MKVLRTTLIIAFVFSVHAFAEKKSPSAAPAAAMQTSKGDELSTVFKTKYSAATYQAKFVQRTKNALLKSEKTSSGIIQIKRPGNFRWETQSPDKSLLVSDSRTVWYYTPPFREGERGQVLIRKAADVHSKTAIDLLSGGADLKSTFRTKRVKEGHFELKPLKNAGDINRIELFLEKSTKLVYKLTLFHTTGNETELTLNDVQLGMKLEDSQFKFTVPEGTETIKQ